MIDVSTNDLLLIIGRLHVEVEALRIKIVQLEAELKNAQEKGDERVVKLER